MGSFRGSSPDKTDIVVIGGGTAGWMAASALVSMLPERMVSVTLIESEAIGIVGVGEATLPHLRQFNETIGIDEAEFMAATKATYKLGIEFENWARIGDRYIHPFGAFGESLNGIPFHQIWLHARPDAGMDDLEACSLPIAAARRNRFAKPAADASDIRSSFGYAYQFDATQYAPFLRRHAEARGARRIEGRVVGVERHAESGDIAAVRLESGEEISGDYFFDCSGFRGLLIEQALEAGYETWDHWLPCNRAVALPCEAREPIGPYTRATARSAGWQWRIPLQHRIGNGHVYASDFISDAEAERILLDGIEGEALAEPRVLRFTTGKRKTIWSHNCISAGLSSGFLEPLESTSIHLTQLAITNFIELFPCSGNARLERERFNAIMDREFERVRDFLILHYTATERDDSDFWNHVRTMDLPASLEEKMALFKARGRVARYQQGLFLEPSWLAVYLGQRVRPDAVDVRAAALPRERLDSMIGEFQTRIATVADGMPSHADALAALEGQS